MPSQTVPPPPYLHTIRRPRFWRPLAHSFVLERLGRIARHGVEAPGELAGLGVDARRSKPRTGIFGAGDADDHFSLGDARSHGEGVVVLRIGDARFPHWFAGFASSATNRPSMNGSDDLARRTARCRDSRCRSTSWAARSPDSLPDPSATSLCRCAHRRRTRCSSW